MRFAVLALSFGVLATGPHEARAAIPTEPHQAATASAVVPTAVAPSATVPSVATCIERIPEGKQRPTLVEKFPERGKSGHQAVFVVELQHGPGERVLPSALDVDEGSSAFRALRSAGFRFPSTKGPARPRVDRVDGAGHVVSRFRLPLLLLPEKPGRAELVLPPLPIAIARASGEIVTACTTAHTIIVEDPTANEPDARPKPNPAPTRQRETFTALRNAVYGGAVGLVAAVLLGFAARTWMRRPKRLPPPPPPRPPWEVALEGLEDVRRACFIEQGRLGEHFDQVSHVLRKYLGERYEFDGLESTSREILEALRRRQLNEENTLEIRRFLDECDLVKFANITPTEAQCHWLWDVAHGVVQRTREEMPPGAAEGTELPRDQ
jgi:hypothetical protein